jgi:ornithine cyclodeaminase
MAGSPSFAVKIATGFYDNVRLGLPSANGVILLFDARTGAPRCLFQDEGWMTAWRTAAATAIAAHCLSPVADPLVGIVGTRLQAQLTPAWISEVLPGARFMITGRNPTRTHRVAAAIDATPVATVNQLLADADIVITATPSAEPLFAASQIRPGMHFVALGADGAEKQELPTDLFPRATHILCDDIQQCAVLSDFGKAVGAGAIGRDRAMSLGAVLGGDVTISRMPDDITIVDLTGLAAQDIAIADWFGTRLE